MSLIPEQEMTEKNLAAHRANGAHSQGAVYCARWASIVRSSDSLSSL